MDDSSRARLGRGAAMLGWLFEPVGDVDRAGRAFLLGQLLRSPAAALMGSFCALTIILVAFLRTDSGLFILLGGLELAVASGRVIDWRRREARVRRNPCIMPTIDGAVLLSALWCSLQGVLAFTIMRGDDMVLCVLAATLVMAMFGPICARNYAAPRFAFLLILLVDLPFVAGAVVSAEPWFLVILLITPPFLLGATQIIVTFHKALLATLEAHARMLHLAQHDSLTGILNRQGMDDALGQITPQPDRHMALISIDLDGFKAVNDRHGHGAGDVLLMHVAERLKAQLRPGDLLARMGGDEFMVVVPDMATHQIGPLADRLIAAISRYTYDLGDGVIVRVGASIGFACLPEDATNTVELRLRADEALYAAKEAGKGVGRRYGGLAASAPPLGDASAA
ncbi:GGDEF domain-containing protein [Sphingobium sp. HBC34]|uniref:GGDEF domain-containing protein n=1 Tax=Sphingobium cyanobacteriorum TaxID=3063954 RepID=A0ABT8ZR26_9SPHN|nr:GGDEF domain-containing protein [Sphingobium sp. HBC34]MDO7836913.1 GGDEF domain-containing protein [Sphingobium sp. HBC34]